MRPEDAAKLLIELCKNIEDSQPVDFSPSFSAAEVMCLISQIGISAMEAAKSEPICAYKFRMLFEKLNADHKDET